MYQESIINGHEVLSDGGRVWVNGPDGASVARFSVIPGLSQAAIDVHRPFCEQQEKGPCLDCTNGPISRSIWARFVASVHMHYGIIIPDSFMPEAIRDAR